MRNILYYLSTIHISQNVQNKIHNLQFRLKKLKATINGSTKSPQFNHKYCLSLGTCDKYVSLGRCHKYAV